MNCWLVELKFNSPLHLGKAGIGMEAVENFIRSDTLFGGLCHAWAAVYGDNSLRQLLDSFRQGKPPFKISSAFPYKDETFFLPRPLLPVRLPAGTDEPGVLKEVNRLAFVAVEMFKDWVRGKPVDVKSIPRVKEKLIGAMAYHRVPRVQLDRVTAASSLFHAGMVVFGAGAGLYCLVKAEDKSWREKLEGVFAWLGENGLGGMRNIGYGQYEARWSEPGREWEELLGCDSAHAGAWCLLSLVYPAPQERGNSLDGARFEVITRGGWATSPQTLQQVRRKSCRMFAEGSVLPYLPEGCIADVTPAGWDNSLHPLYRYGYAFAVPVEVN